MSAARDIILLAEDNEDDVFAFQRAVKKAQIENLIHIAMDGKSALDYLKGEGEFGDRAKHPLPFLIFLDLKLPNVSGFEILKWIRGQPSLDRIVVVVLTSSAEMIDKQQAYSLGARSYIVKPPSAMDLRDVTASLESFWLRHGSSGPIKNRLSDTGPIG